MKKNYWKDFSWASKNMNQHLFLGMVMAFDLPVIHYRSLIHEVSSPLYWEVGVDRKKSLDLIIINLDIITDILI